LWRAWENSDKAADSELAGELRITTRRDGRRDNEEVAAGAGWVVAAGS
jgi:hypothetical protein